MKKKNPKQPKKSTSGKARAAAAKTKHKTEKQGILPEHDGLIDDVLEDVGKNLSDLGAAAAQIQKEIDEEKVAGAKRLHEIGRSFYPTKYGDLRLNLGKESLGFKKKKDPDVAPKSKKKADKEGAAA